MSGKSSRAKGAQGERDLATRLRKIFPGAKRGIGQTRSAKECCDVEGTPYWIELKTQRKANVRAALEQAERDTDGRAPVAVIRDTGKPAFVVMRLETWEALALARVRHPSVTDVFELAEKAGLL